MGSISYFDGTGLFKFDNIANTVLENAMKKQENKQYICIMFLTNLMGDMV